MKERRTYRGLASSSVLHGALLGLIVLGFASALKFEESPEAIPVETVSLTELNKIMNGEKDARPLPRPPPAPPEAPPDLRVAEEPTPPPPAKTEPAPPLKPEPPPLPRPAAQDAPEPPERPKVVDTPAERPKEPAPEKIKPDQIAKLVEREKTEPQPKPKPPSRAFDPNAIAKAIAENKPSEPSTAPTQVSVAPQGLPRHDAQRMSVSMASALDAWLTESYLNCWTPPPTIPEGETYVAQIKVIFKADGSLSARPVLLNPPTDPAWRAHAESAMRAVRKCDPLHVPAQYAPYFDEWKVETIHFDPRETQG